MIKKHFLKIMSFLVICLIYSISVAGENSLYNNTMYNNVMSTNHSYQILVQIMLSKESLENMLTGSGIIFVLWAFNAFCDSKDNLKLKFVTAKITSMERMQLWSIALLASYVFQIILFQVGIKDMLYGGSFVEFFKDRNLSWWVMAVLASTETIVIGVRVMYIIVCILNGIKTAMLSIFKLTEKEEPLKEYKKDGLQFSTFKVR